MQEGNNEVIGPSPGGPSQQPAMRMKLTPEEMLTLQTCSKESFYYRCVPLGILFMGSTSILAKRGILRSHPRLGSIPKSLAAGLVGYIIGKVSYQGECRRKIMALENSPLAESMRKGKRGRDLMSDISSLPSLSTLYPGQDTTTEDNVEVKLSDSYSENTPQFSGLDDSKRPSLDQSMRPSSQSSSETKFSSYEELRERNRVDYTSKQNSKNDPQAKKPASSPSLSSPSDSFSASVRRNQYGDVVEE